MANAIDQIGYGLTVGRAGLGFWGDGVGSVRQQVSDGDTISLRADGNLGVRLLGVDAPELGFTLPTDEGYESLSEATWERFLQNPFADGLPPFEPTLDDGLVEHLRSRAGSGAAENHYRYAQAAEDALEAEILADLEALDQTQEEFRFFLAFAYEIVDQYGRLLCYLNRYQPNKNQPEPRPKSYNERLLSDGRIAPYFIWPNVDPFYTQEGSLVDAVVEPGKAAELAAEGALGEARQAVRDARERRVGIFSSDAPLRLQAFEVRILAERLPPDRWVIDLSKEDEALIPPQKYYEIPNAEDRLFIPQEYVPLFVEAGWRRGA